MTIIPKPHHWVGDAPKRCHICRGPLGNVFTDGKIPNGSWTSICDDCIEEHGVGLVNRQRYKRQYDGRWLKIAG